MTFASAVDSCRSPPSPRGQCSLSGGRPVRSDAEAARYIDERGFALLMPIKGVPLPSLSAANGAAPWAEDFQCTDAAWEWKETLPGQKLCSYLKLIRGRGTFVSWRLYPAFYAAYGPVGDPNEEYEEGRLGRAERDLALVVAEHGPLDSRQLWRRTKPLFGGKRSRFTAALDRLQAGFILTVAGGSTEGWSLHTWDLVTRQVPEGCLDKLPTPAEARRILLRQAVENCVAAPERVLAGLLRMSAGQMASALRDLYTAGEVVKAAVEGEREPWVAARPFSPDFPGTRSGSPRPPS